MLSSFMDVVNGLECPSRANSILSNWMEYWLIVLPGMDGISFGSKPSVGPSFSALTAKSGLICSFFCTDLEETLVFTLTRPDAYHLPIARARTSASTKLRQMGLTVISIRLLTQSVGFPIFSSLGSIPPPVLLLMPCFSHISAST